MPQVTKGFDSIYGYPYTEKWATAICESSIWSQLSTAFPIVDHQLANFFTFCNMFVSAWVLVCLHTRMYVVGYVLLVLRMYLDMLDGSVARECSATRFGNMFDHGVNILFTIGIFTILLVNPIPKWIKYVAIVIMALVVYANVQLIYDEKKQDKLQFLEDNNSITWSLVYATISMVLHTYS